MESRPWRTVLHLGGWGLAVHDVTVHLKGTQGLCEPRYWTSGTSILLPSRSCRNWPSPDLTLAVTNPGSSQLVGHFVYLQYTYCALNTELS